MAISKLSTNLEKINTSVVGIRTALNAEGSSIDTLPAKIGEIQTSVLTLTSKVDTLNNTIAKKEEIITTQNATIEELRASQGSGGSSGLYRVNDMKALNALLEG